MLNLKKVCTYMTKDGNLFEIYYYIYSTSKSKVNNILYIYVSV